MQNLLANVVTSVLKLQEGRDRRMIGHILAQKTKVCLHTLRAALLIRQLSGGDITVNVAERLLRPRSVGNIRFADGLQ